jgi:hypothetical protein
VKSCSLWTDLINASFFSFCSASVESCQKVATESAPADTIVFSSLDTAIAQIWPLAEIRMAGSSTDLVLVIVECLYTLFVLDVP